MVSAELTVSDQATSPRAFNREGKKGQVRLAGAIKANLHIN